MNGRNTTFTMILLMLCTLAVVPKVARALPPPDGRYPGFTTAEGCNALKFLTSGLANTGLGWYSLWSDTTGSSNTGVGAATLALNNADNNTALGAGALLLNNASADNTASGAFALSLCPAKSSDAIKERLMAMVKAKKES